MFTLYKNLQGKKAVVVLSGGQDSTTCAYWAKAQGMVLSAITFNYGQRHAIELEAAREVARRLGITDHEILDIGNGVLQGTSPLVDKHATLEQYADHHSLPGGLEKTFVPMRNQLFLTIAANRAYCVDARHLVTGVCQEDNGGYPDCTEEFISRFEEVSGEGTFTGDDGAPAGLRVLTPLMHLTKADSVKLALELEGCYEALAFSHTAYDGAFPPVGHDHATLLRAKGFEEAGVPDPLVLRCFAQGLMDLPHTANYGPDVLPPYLHRLGYV